MILPFATRRESQPEAQAQIDRTLHLLQNVRVPNRLNDRIESRLASARLSLVEKNSEVNASGGSFNFWHSARVAACALAVAAASFGLVADRSVSVRPTAPVPVASHYVPHSGMDSAAAVRVPTHAVTPGKLAPGRAAHTLDGGRNTLAKRGVLPPGVAVPNHPPAAPVTSAPEPENDGSSR
jgi:hypothetical protein